MAGKARCTKNREEEEEYGFGISRGLYVVHRPMLIPKLFFREGADERGPEPKIGNVRWDRRVVLEDGPIKGGYPRK